MSDSDHPSNGTLRLPRIGHENLPGSVFIRRFNSIFLGTAGLLAVLAVAVGALEKLSPHRSGPAVAIGTSGEPASSRSDPEAIIQRQVEAYNARDLEAFVSYYRDDVEVYRFPNTLEFAGAAALREQYGRLFASAPQLNVTITRRIVQGSFVIDHEVISGVPDRPPASAAAIYQIRDAKIWKVWFIF